MCFSYEQPHQQQIACYGNGAGRKIESQKPGDGLNKTPVGAIDPSEAFVPHEIVQHCRLDGKRRRKQVAHTAGGE